MEPNTLPDILNVGTEVYVLYFIGLLLSNAVLTLFVSKYLNRKKDKAETDNLNIQSDHLIVQNYQSIVEALQTEVERQKQTIIELKERMDRYSARELELMKKIHSLEQENVTLRKKVNKLILHEKKDSDLDTEKQI